jgi:hypothetical protein
VLAELTDAAGEGLLALVVRSPTYRAARQSGRDLDRLVNPKPAEGTNDRQYQVRAIWRTTNSLRALQWPPRTLPGIAEGP